MSITNQDPTALVIMRVKQCTNINELKVLRRQHDGNGRVQSVIITRTRELHEAAIAAAEELYRGKSSVNWDGQPLDV
jgi:hypothetical protein